MIPFIHNYVLTDEDFENLRTLIYKTCGINLTETKKQLMHARLSSRLREGGFESFKEYYQFLIKKDSGAELVRLVDAVSTNLTSFFRGPAHFEYLTNEAFPKIFAGPRSSSKVRFWSAGCSSGEEPYSLAITMLKYLGSPAGIDIKILGSDISTRALKQAISGVYDAECMANIPKSDMMKFFDILKHEEDYYYRVKDFARDLIMFRRLNLMHPLPFKEVFDMILCRNVMIYFDFSTQEILVNKFYDCLKPGGLFLIGHAESLTAIKQPFKYIMPAVYIKK